MLAIINILMVEISEEFMFRSILFHWDYHHLRSYVRFGLYRLFFGAGNTLNGFIT